MNKTTVLRFVMSRFLAMSMLFSIGACGSENEAASGALPSDERVVADVMPGNKDGFVDLYVTNGKRGEAYLHEDDLTWYWDRGVVVKRNAEIAGVPDAVLVVGGLARYQRVGDRYQYYKFLTTYNEYEGIPAPRDDELVDFVKGNLLKVFMSRDHLITEVSSVELSEGSPWIWHTAKSFSVPFNINYKYIKSNTTIEARDDLFDIRFYRTSVDSPVDKLLATERSRKQTALEQHTVDDIQNMKTLRSGL